MPLQSCTAKGRKGVKWGASGKCYLGKGARAKAKRQMRAIKHSQATANTRKRPARNPLRLDPSRTATLRRRFISEMNRRFTLLRNDIVDLLLKEDAFGLTRNVFCATGEGGGVDPTCKAGGGGGSTPSEITAKDVGAILSQQWHNVQAREKEKEFGSLADTRRYEAEFLQDKWVSSETFKLVEIPIDFAGATAPVHSGTQSKTDAPIIVDENPGGYGRLHGHFGAPPRVLILDGKHRVAEAKARGDKTIKAYVGDKALRHLQTTNMTSNTRFMFQTKTEQVEAFRKWLRRQVALRVVGEERVVGDEWWERYVQEGYRQGAGRAFEDTKRRAKGQVRDFYDGSKAEFLRSSFGRPVTVEKTKLLAGRVYTDLKGITDAMSTKLVRTLTDGLVQGKNPRVIAKDITDDVAGIGRRRAEVLARTEIIRTHAEGQLDAFEAMGVTDVGVAAEWATAEDERVCDLCAPLHGVVMKVEEARNLLPRHPQCRCAWLPANVGESDEGQKDTKRSIDRAIARSLDAEGRGDKTTWPGADADVDKERPESILDNVFCPTGEGGGVDPTCSPGGGAIASSRVSVGQDGRGVVVTDKDGFTSYAGVHENEWQDWAYYSHDINDTVSGNPPKSETEQGEPVTQDTITQFRALGDKIQRAAENNALTQTSVFRGESYDSEADLRAVHKPGTRKEPLSGITSVGVTEDVATDYMRSDSSGPVKVLVRYTNPNGIKGVQTSPLGVPSAEVVLPRGDLYKTTRVFKREDGVFIVDKYSAEKHKLPRVDASSPMPRSSS